MCVFFSKPCLMTPEGWSMTHLQAVVVCSKSQPLDAQVPYDEDVSEGAAVFNNETLREMMITHKSGSPGNSTDSTSGGAPVDAMFVGL